MLTNMKDSYVMAYFYGEFNIYRANLTLELKVPSRMAIHMSWHILNCEECVWTDGATEIGYGDCVALAPHCGIVAKFSFFMV